MMNKTTTPSITKKDQYLSLIQQIEALVAGEKDLIANLANTVASIKSSMGFLWVGCYFVKGEQLVLGPFQGPPACTRITFGAGVCGASWAAKKTIIVDDVNLFPGHIACSFLSKSEIVTPVMDQSNDVRIILDIDSEQLASFDETDQLYLEKISQIIARLL